jgi:hypothetical protein
MFMAVGIKIRVVRVITPCCFLRGYHRSVGSSRPSLQGKDIADAVLKSPATLFYYREFSRINNLCTILSFLGECAEGVSSDQPSQR